MNHESISICVTTYNGEEYIEQQLLSILQQLPNEYDEVLVSDDGSTDNTISIVKNIKDPRVKLINANLGNLIKNVEYVISKSIGNYIFLADQDDIWLPNKIGSFLNLLQNNSFVYSNVRIIDTNNNVVIDNLYPLGVDKSGLIKNLIKNSIIGATVAFRREILKKVMPFPENIPMHDQWIGAIASLYYTVAYTDEPLILYRRHGSNQSTTGSKSDKSTLTQIKDRYSIALGLIMRLFS